MLSSTESEARKLRLAARGKRLLETADSFGAQLQSGGARVLLDVDDARRLRNRERAGLPAEEREGDLARSLPVRAGDRGKDLSAPGTRSGKPAGPERAVSDERRSQLLAKRDQPGVRVPLLEMVQHLVTGDPAPTRQGHRLLHALLVEVAHAVRAHLARLAKLLERLDGGGERVPRFPVQQIAIEVVGTEPPQAPLARDHRTAPGGVLGQDLRDEEDLVAPPLHRLRDHLLHGAAAVHLRRIDVAEPEIEPAPERRDRLASRVLLHLP